METSQNKTLRRWLYLTCIVIAILVVFGGYVRLTRSGLSIVEWNVITGVVPPIGEQAWNAEFAKYQQTPEFKIINRSMTLHEYKSIYYVEYIHRLVGRLAGLVYVIPLFFFLIRGTIPWRKSWPYLAIGLGFAFQGALGWYMVASGLVDKPRVSQYRLAAHLITALGLLGFTFWVALRHVPTLSAARTKEKRAAPLQGMALGMFAVVLVQVAYGAFVAALKAGHVSNTWPLMFGRVIPPGLLTILQPWYANLTSTAVTVHFVHRWFAFVVLAFAIWAFYRARKINAPSSLQTTLKVILGIVSLQITLGVLVVLFNVAISLALLHQATAIGLFLSVVYLNYQLFARKIPVVHPSITPIKEGIVPVSGEGVK